MTMKLETYNKIISVIESFQGRNYECEKLLQEKFPDIMSETLRSIYEIFYQRKMRRIHSRFRRSAKDLYKRYKVAVKNKESLGILVRMADELDLSAALLARLIVEEYYKEAEEEYITKVMDESDNSGRRNPSFRGDDSIRSDDTHYGLSDDNTENSNASTNNLDSNASGKAVQKQEAGNSATKTLDGKLSHVNENVEVKVSKNACTRGSKSNKHTKRKHKVGRSSTAGNSDSPTSPVAPEPDPATPDTTSPVTPDVDVAAAVHPAPDVDAPARAAAANKEESTRITISDLINDTTLIKDKDLAYEVFLCHIEDDQYGPVIDCYRQSIGHHYEILLLQWVKKNNLVVQDEAALRKFGFDKTPDVKLDLPIAINGAPIMWIESKAIFGDEEIHETYYNDQYIRYWNRFGPGLVIYWLGYLETISTAEEKRILIRHELPADITKYSPDSIRTRKFTEKPFGAS